MFCGGVLIRRILPLKSVLDDVDDAADDTPVIHTGSTMRTGKERLLTLAKISFLLLILVQMLNLHLILILEYFPNSKQCKNGEVHFLI